MLKFNCVPDSRIETILQSIRHFPQITQDGSTLKRIGFTTNDGLEGYIQAGDYGSSLKIYLEVKPKFFTVLLADDLDEKEFPALMKIIRLKNHFPTKEDAKKFISDLGKEADYLTIVEVDPNQPEKICSGAKTLLDEIPF